MHPTAEKNLNLHFRHKVEKIIVENDEVKGVSGINEGDNSPFEVEADSTIIATGGIGGNIELFTNFIINRVALRYTNYTYIDIF
ncbi:MAG: FAD-binding protein, partial [Thiohalomonadales bacterium]